MAELHQLSPKGGRGCEYSGISKQNPFILRHRHVDRGSLCRPPRAVGLDSCIAVE